MNAQDFQYISDFVRAESAIVLEKGKEYLVESRLSPIVRDLGIHSISELVQLVKQIGEKDIRRRVVEALTTNETSFFRDVEPFQVIKEQVLPELIKQRQNVRELSIWSAAASTGQEAYTIAMTIQEHFPQLGNWKVKIVGTDLSHDVLERARKGVYSQIEINRGLPANFLIKYFEKNGTEWQVKDSIRSMVQFHQLNLVKPWQGISGVDILMLRNVLIYFDVPTKKGIFEQVRRVLKPDGVMFLGAAETTLNIDENFERKAALRGSYYVKRPASTS